MTLVSRLAGAWPVALAGLIVSLLIGMFVPVYTDEIGWRFQERAALDGVDTLFNDLCGPNTLAVPPWFMMPVRYFSALANGIFAAPFFVRLEGVLCALMWTGLLLVLTRKVAREGGSPLRTLSFSLIGLGVLPFLLVLSRPEQPIILAMTLILLVTFHQVPKLDPRYLAGAKIAVILALLVAAQSYHLKGVLYAPVAAVCVLVCARGKDTLLLRLVGLGAVGAFTLAAAQYWISRLSCPGDPVLAAMYARENIAAVFDQRGDLLSKVSEVIAGANPLNYVFLAAPQPEPMSNWLPAGVFSPALSTLFIIVTRLLWITSLLLAIYSLVSFIVSEKSRALADARVPIAITIFATMLVWGASQLSKNVYEASHVLPMLVVFGLLCLSLPGQRERLGRVTATLSSVAMPIALLGQILILGAVTGPLLAAAKRPGYVTLQPYSVSIAGYERVQQDIRRAMLRAGMPPAGQLRRLLVDDVTYLALQDSRLPLHRLGVLSVWKGSITDPAAYLRSRGSDGVVVGCRYLPSEMRANAAVSGDICAISRQALEHVEVALGAT